jgi:hypothetical protein
MRKSRVDVIIKRVITPAVSLYQDFINRFIDASITLLIYELQ